MKQLGKHVPDETQIMFGLAVDPKLGDMMTVTLISSLTAQQMALEPSADAILEPRITSRQAVAKPAAEKAPAYSGNGLQLHAPVGLDPAPVAPAPAPAPAPVRRPEPPSGELFSSFVEQPQPVMEAPVVAPAPAPAPAPLPPAALPPRQAQVVAVPVQEVPLFEEPVQEAPVAAAPLVMEAPAVPFAVPAPAAPTPLVMEAPQSLPEPPPAPAPAPAPVAMPEPVHAEAPRHETVEPEVVVVKEQSIKATSILVQPHTASGPVPIPAPVAPPKHEEEVQPLVKQSIFSMVDEDEDEEDGEDEEGDEEIVDEMDDAQEEAEAKEEPRSPEAAASHWADKYIQPKPHAGVQPTVEPRREPQRTLQATATAPAKKVIEVKQPSLNLQQEEVARFKGTDKTIVDGDDLDIPTWMRLRGKVKR
jgi:hypothetical protein